MSIWTQIYDQIALVEFILSTIILLFGVFIAILITRMKKMSFNYYAKSVSKTVERQTKQIAQLEKKLTLHERKGQGVVTDWAIPREDRSAYLLELYNDSPNKIFNVEAQINPTYETYCKLFWKNNKIEPEKTLHLFFVPGGWTPISPNAANRKHFLEVWLENKLQPITFTIRYTEAPNKANFQTITTEFTTEHLSSHLKRSLAALQSKPNLKAVPPKD